MRVGRRYFFTAVHSLPELSAPWNRKHGHRYTVEVEAEGEGAYVVDMEKWDVVGAHLAAKHNGRDLDDMYDPSTVENIATFLVKDFSGATAVTVWEDDDRWARAEA